MAIPLNPVGLFKIDLQSAQRATKLVHLSQKEHCKGGVRALLKKIVLLFNENVVSEAYSEYVDYSVPKGLVAKYGTRVFKLIWFSAIRLRPPNTTTQSLMKILGDNIPEGSPLKMIADGSVKPISEHHLIFLYEKKSRGEKAFTKRDVFALTTNQANRALRSVADFFFPLTLARRVCMSVFFGKTEVPLFGDSIGGTRKFTGKSFRYSSMESLNEIVQSFDTKLLTTSSFYEQLPCFEQFAEKKYPLNIAINEMGIRFYHNFSLDQYASICSQILEIFDEDPTYPLRDPVNPAFEYFDHIRKVPPTEKSQIGALETALLHKVYDAYVNGSHGVEFYHHHYNEYMNAMTFALRERNKQKNFRSWEGSPPTLSNIIDAIKEKYDPKNIAEFCDCIHKISFIYPSRQLGGKLKKTNLLSLFKGDVFYREKQYFFLSGNWVEVQGSYYAHVYNEFRKTFGKRYILKGEPGSITDAWVNDISWYCFSLDDLEKKYTELKEEKFNTDWTSDKKRLVGKNGCLEKISYKNGSKTVNAWMCNRDPFEMSESYKRELAPDFLQFLERQWKRKQNYAHKEEEFNRRFFGSPGYLVFDQVYAASGKGNPNNEMFDLLYFTDEELYIYHIKKTFGQDTRDACSQIRVGSESVRRSLEIGHKTDVLSDLFDRAIKCEGKGDKKFKRRVKEQLLALDEDPIVAKQKFLELFRTRKIIVVYAFLDTAKVERDLGAELRGNQYEVFTADHFNHEDCTHDKRKRKGVQQLVSHEEIYESLKEEEYIDERGRPGEKLIKLSSLEEFSLPKLDEKLIPKNKKSIVEILNRCRSNFDSFIAKKELLDTKKYLRNLGMKFRITQIFRDGKPPAELSFSMPSLQLKVQDQLPSHRDYFTFGNRGFTRRNTSGRGSCSLHALLGEERDGWFIFPTDSKDPHLAAKLLYTEELHKKREEVKEKFIAFLLDLTVRFKGDKTGKELRGIFKTVINGWIEEWNRRDADLKKCQLQRIQLFLQLIQGRKDFLALLNKIRKLKDEWRKLGDKQFFRLLQTDKAQETLSNQWTTLMGFADKLLVGQLTKINKQVEAKKAGRDLKSFYQRTIEENFDQILLDYANTVVSEIDGKEYWLSDLELEIASILFGKKLLLMMAPSGDQGIHPYEKAHYYNMQPSEEPDVVILHQPGHYSRCTPFNEHLKVKKEE